MSGIPNKEGVAKVIALISKESTLTARKDALSGDIRRAENELARIERELAEVTKARIVELSTMDVSQPDSAGMGAFLAEVILQATASIPSRGGPA